MLKNLVILASVFVLLTLSSFSTLILEKNENVCGSPAWYGVNYMMEDNNDKYSWGFYLFGDAQMNTRNLIPAVRNIIHENGSILLDSCNICRPFFQYNSATNYHKYISEIRLPNVVVNSTIALEYGPSSVIDSTLGDRAVKAGFSYFITLAESDTIASQYSPHEVTETHVFSDGYNNSLYEILYNGNVVGIRYFCANNNQLYIRYFISKQ
ncbi:MAG: hypothetical protein KF896_00875 [Ignavibacteriae bacterium]|nr:hypothetical protein [Ignavibacteriota bacterium]